ncbi:M20 family metallo-hydrolase [Cumulibacter manganitolerans]|uniref:M20 family metallo-hydrolase n=1 Tax=Cumulibacter manganitolerans TaxID=1884992 RepID=UPI00129596B2|nr:M20 family metallo-hydrolase [Cumulibacter manganitolerans]
MDDSQTLGPTDADFLADFAAMSAFGATGNGGVDRQAATAADAEQRAWMAELLERFGARVQYDEIGNQFGLIELRPGAPYVMVGSHMDSQPTAGKYDGAYGVLAAAHTAARLAAQWRSDGTTPTYNLAVVNWFNEEGSRFKPSMMGSGVFTGKLDLAATLEMTDVDGVTVYDALELIGQRGNAPRPDVAAYAEIHVEQGKGLEKDGLTIGVVEATWGANKYELTVHGEQGHTGATLMPDRCDALLGASMLVVAAREIAEAFEHGPLQTSVGQMLIYPNSPVVIASEVTVLLDLRSPDADVLAGADVMLHARIAEVERKANVEVRQATSHRWGVQPYTEAGVALAEQVADDLGLKRGRTMTLAGHDSTNMKDVVPTVFLFVPSVDGVSHNEGELTHDEDMIDGLRMLTETVRRLCDGALG